MDETQQQEQAPPSPASSTSSDAFNTTPARLHFGPLRSPEKRFIATQSDTLKPASPNLRRSPRLSSPIPASRQHRVETPPPPPLPDLSGVGMQAGHSRVGTPDIDTSADDEPSSVLASRVMRAHDNPSPPPSPAGSPLKSLTHDPTIDPSDSPMPCPPGLGDFGNLMLTDNTRIFHPIPKLRFGDTSISPAPSPPGSPFPAIRCDDEEPNLLSTDELTSIATTSVSPQQQFPMDQTLTPILLSPMLPDTMSSQSDAETEDERTVIEALSIPDESATPSPAPEMPEDEPSPARRSGRARRRPSQIPVELTANPAVESKNQPKDPLEAEQEQKDGPGIEMQHEASGSRRRRGGHPQNDRLLGSLSPSSSNTLTQLIPSMTATMEVIDEVTTPERPAQEETPAPTASILANLPVRFPSPSRSRHPTSPTKFQFNAMDLNDINRTPARRIPLDQAVAQGQLSPERAQQMFRAAPVPGSATRPTIFSFAPSDSPARRVPVNLKTVPPPTKPWVGFRSASPTRSRSVEPKGPETPKLKARSGSVEPVSKPKTDFTFPKQRTVASSPIQPPTRKLPFPITSQPATLDAAIPEESEELLSVQAQPTLKKSALKQPTSRIPRMASKPYSKKVPTPETPAVKVIRRVELHNQIAGPSTAHRKSATIPSFEQTARTAAGPSNGALKRKRDIESQLSPTKPRSVGPIRQMPPTARLPTTSEPRLVMPSPVKLRPVVEIRTPPVSTDMVVDDVAMPAEPPVATVEIPHHSNVPDADIPPVEEDDFDPLRRTTRSRRLAGSEGRPLPNRRRAPLIQDTGPFSNMSAVALKALTNSNTVKNQHYLTALLQMEIVHKNGERPESPVMKVKTNSQKQQEEKERMRGLRAARRAKRHGDVADTDTGYSSPTVEDDDDDDETDQLDSSPLRHKRGPGDEEDYVTPRSQKRDRTDDDGDVEMEMHLQKKRVKWDRGLSTAVCLEDVHPQPKAHPKENIARKGCLAPTAKALHLDILGNLNTDSPLQNIVQENVVVQKFVYDNDEVEPPLPVIVVKNTRSKSKKGKP